MDRRVFERAQSGLSDSDIDAAAADLLGETSDEERFLEGQDTLEGQAADMVGANIDQADELSRAGEVVDTVGDVAETVGGALGGVTGTIVRLAGRGLGKLAEVL